MLATDAAELATSFSASKVTASMRSMISIITCERKGVSYLDATAAALLHEGADECDHRLVLVDGEPPVVWPAGWGLDMHWPRGGVRVMMWKAFEKAVAAGVDRLIFCEDDITPCRNAVRLMLKVGIPDEIAFIDFHDMEALPDEIKPGLYPLSLAKGYAGNQCMVFPRRTMEWLLKQNTTTLYFREDKLSVAADAGLARLLMTSPWPTYLAHMPRVIRHDGAVSAAHPELGLHDVRATRGFVGVEFDALSLLAPSR